MDGASLSAPGLSSAARLLPSRCARGGVATAPTQQELTTRRNLSKDGAFLPVVRRRRLPAAPLFAAHLFVMDGAPLSVLDFGGA
eukprot:5413772-Pyramimonas_sp.AAC.1